MLSKVIFTFLLVALFLPRSFAIAGMEINEIMYDLKSGSDDGREWVEVYNNGNETIDFSTYKFFEADTNHKITIVSGSAKIEPYGYALIVSDFAKFKIDWPNVFNITASSGTPPQAVVFDSAFSLNNTGESLAIKNGEQVTSQYSYTSASGAAGNGKSLQKINGAWVSSVPTPGSENKILYVPPPVQPKKEVNLSENFAIKKVQITEEVESSVQGELPSLPAVQSLNDIEEKNSQTNIFIYVFLLFLGSSAIFLYFLRKKPKIVETEEDFEILE